MERPATASDRSRPPTPRQWETPIPAPSSSDISCWAPVPEAATSPTGPGRTTLANPSPTPPTTAVPQSGPITSTPARSAYSLSATSCSSGTLSLNTMVSRPASTASTASAKANRPGVEISATVASPERAAAASVTGGGADPKPAATGRAVSASAASASASPPARAASESASSASSMWWGVSPPGRSKPIPVASSRFRSVAIATSADRTPSTALTLLLTCISVTEST